MNPNIILNISQVIRYERLFKLFLKTIRDLPPMKKHKIPPIVR
jgi:hypothetical protein